MQFTIREPNQYLLIQIPIPGKSIQKKLKKKFPPKTKAIMAVHIYGHPCEMDEILKIA